MKVELAYNNIAVEQRHRDSPKSISKEKIMISNKSYDTSTQINGSFMILGKINGKIS